MVICVARHVASCERHFTAKRRPVTPEGHPAMKNRKSDPKRVRRAARKFAAVNGKAAWLNSAAGGN
jgi:hypothetical protein